jgi:hemoglobin-like flavoprotein
MTPEQIELVRSSWSQLDAHREETARLLYGRLFELDPALRALFGNDLQAQGTKLMATLNVVVTHIDHLVPLLPPLRQLAVRHLDWQVRPEHYDLLGRALMDTLSNGLGDTFGPDCRDAWGAAYADLAEAMKAAAYPHDPGG